jgi:actin-related protein
MNFFLIISVIFFLKADFPSYTGIIEEYVDETENMDTNSETASKPSIRQSQKRYLIDTMSVKNPKKNMHIQSYLKDGLIEDWDLCEKVLQYIFGKHLRCDASKHPILMSEPVVSYFIVIFSVLKFNSIFLI